MIFDLAPAGEILAEFNLLLCKNDDDHAYVEESLFVFLVSFSPVRAVTLGPHGSEHVAVILHSSIRSGRGAQGMHKMERLLFSYR